MKNDEFGDRMKSYENADMLQAYSGHLPLYMRLDGRSFSKFTKRLSVVKPRDARLSAALEKATTKTMNEFGMIFGFSQSDEISLFFPVLDNPESQLPFGGKTRKLLSVVPSFFTATFIKAIELEFSDNPYAVETLWTMNPCFDARIVEFPSKAEAVNMLVWRWQDASRNYITDTAHRLFSEKELHGKSTVERLAMITEKGQTINSKNIATFIRPFKYELTNDQGETIIRNKVQTCYPENGFENMTFDQRVEFVYEPLLAKLD